MATHWPPRLALPGAARRHQVASCHRRAVGDASADWRCRGTAEPNSKRSCRQRNTRDSPPPTARWEASSSTTDLQRLRGVAASAEVTAAAAAAATTAEEAGGPGRRPAPSGRQPIRGARRRREKLRRWLRRELHGASAAAAAARAQQAPRPSSLRSPRPRRGSGRPHGRAAISTERVISGL